MMNATLSALSSAGLIAPPPGQGGGPEDGPAVPGDAASAAPQAFQQALRTARGAWAGGNDAAPARAEAETTNPSNRETTPEPVGADDRLNEEARLEKATETPADDANPSLKSPEELAAWLASLLPSQASTVAQAAAGRGRLTHTSPSRALEGDGSTAAGTAGGSKTNASRASTTVSSRTGDDSAVGQGKDVTTLLDARSGVGVAAAAAGSAAEAEPPHAQIQPASSELAGSSGDGPSGAPENAAASQAANTAPRASGLNASEAATTAPSSSSLGVLAPGLQSPSTPASGPTRGAEQGSAAAAMPTSSSTPITDPSQAPSPSSELARNADSDVRDAAGTSTAASTPATDAAQTAATLTGGTKAEGAPAAAVVRQGEPAPGALHAAAPAQVHGQGLGTDPQTPVQTTVRVPLDHPGFAPAFGARIAVLVREGVDVARVHLNPAEMGPVAVQVSREGTQVRVDLVAEVATTRALLEQSLPVLAGALRDAGFTLNGGGVFQGGGSPSQGQAADVFANAGQGERRGQDEAGRGGPGSGFGRSGASGDAADLPPARLRAPVGLVDLFA